MSRYALLRCIWCINTSRPRAFNIFNLILLHVNCYIFTQVSLKFVAMGSIKQMFPIMARCIRIMTYKTYNVVNWFNNLFQMTTIKRQRYISLTLCEGNPPLTGFPPQSCAGCVSMSRHHHYNKTTYSCQSYLTSLLPFKRKVGFASSEINLFGVKFVYRSFMTIE